MTIALSTKSSSRAVEVGFRTIACVASEDLEKQMERVILTKSRHWTYEQEYRIIRPGQACRSLEYPKELLTGVIFGYMMPGHLRQMIKHWVAEEDCRVAFFEARPKAGEFGLDISRIA